LQIYSFITNFILTIIKTSNTIVLVHFKNIYATKGEE